MDASDRINNIQCAEPEMLVQGVLPQILKVAG